MGRQSPALRPAGRRHACPVTFKQCRCVHLSLSHRHWGGTPWTAGWSRCWPCLHTGCVVPWTLSGPHESLVTRRRWFSHWVLKETRLGEVSRFPQSHGRWQKWAPSLGAPAPASSMALRFPLWLWSCFLNYFACLFSSAEPVPFLVLFSVCHCTVSCPVSLLGSFLLDL